MKTVICSRVFNAVLTSTLLTLAAAVGAAGLPTNATFSGAAYAPSVSAKAENGTKKPRKKSAAKKSKGGGVTFHDGSAESRSERDRRLTRECRGRSNSGVCEGYAY
jgi:hypothetical protein